MSGVYLYSLYESSRDNLLSFVAFDSPGRDDGGRRAELPRCLLEHDSHRFRGQNGHLLVA